MALVAGPGGYMNRLPATISVTGRSRWPEAGQAAPDAGPAMADGFVTPQALPSRADGLVA